MKGVSPWRTGREIRRLHRTQSLPIKMIAVGSGLSRNTVRTASASTWRPDISPQAILEILPLPDGDREAATAAGIPIISATEPIDRLDHAVGGLQALHLARAGHRRLGLVTVDDATVQAFRDPRREGARETAVAVGLTLPLDQTLSARDAKPAMGLAPPDPAGCTPSDAASPRPDRSAATSSNPSNASRWHRRVSDSVKPARAPHDRRVRPRTRTRAQPARSRSSASGVARPDDLDLVGGSRQLGELGLV